MGTHSPAGQQPALDGPSDLTIVRSAGAEPASPDTAEPVRRDHDLAEADRIRRWRPRSLMLLTRYKISVRKRPRMSRRAVRALVAEQEGTAVRDPARATHGEVVVHSVARRKADGVRHSTFQRSSWLLRRTDRLRARKATLHARINLIPHEHVPHPHGGIARSSRHGPTGTPWPPG